MNEKLKAAKAAAEKRAEEASARTDEIELQCLELEEKLSADGKTINRDFVVIRTSQGPLGLVRGDSVLAKKLQVSLGKAKGPDEEHGLVYDFVLEQTVHPQREAAQKLLGDYRFLVDKASDLLGRLHSGEELVQKGKS